MVTQIAIVGDTEFTFENCCQKTTNLIEHGAIIINGIRNDLTRFDGKMIARLCDYFDCDLADLLYFEFVEVDASPES